MRSLETYPRQGGQDEIEIGICPDLRPVFLAANGDEVLVQIEQRSGDDHVAIHQVRQKPRAVYKLWQWIFNGVNPN